MLIEALYPCSFYTNWGLLYWNLDDIALLPVIRNVFFSQICCIKGWRICTDVSSPDFNAAGIQSVPPDFPLFSVFIALLISSLDGGSREMSFYFWRWSFRSRSSSKCSFHFFLLFNCCLDATILISNWFLWCISLSRQHSCDVVKFFHVSMFSCFFCLVCKLFHILCFILSHIWLPYALCCTRYSVLLFPILCGHSISSLSGSSFHQ